MLNKISNFVTSNKEAIVELGVIALGTVVGLALAGIVAKRLPDDDDEQMDLLEQNEQQEQ